MGGHALKNTKVRRYQKEEYFALEAKVLGFLRSKFPENRIEPVLAYGAKDSFGDMDVLVESKHDVKLKMETVLKEAGVTEVVKNGAVWSLGWGDFQVDLLFQKEKYFDSARNYFNYNDLGNLLGRIATRCGFKLGHEGLGFVMYGGNDNTYKFGETNLTTDYDVALEFLGYDPVRFNEGFYNLEEVFEYVTSGELFDPYYFQLENRNADGRKRDKKRPNYMAFLNFVDERKDSFDVKQVTKEDMLQKAFDSFAGFKEWYDQQHHNLKVAQEVSQKFNGKLVSEWTGKEGKELGAIMQKLFEAFGGKESMRAKVYTMTQEEVRDFVLSVS